MSLTDCDYDPTTDTFLTRYPLHGVHGTPVGEPLPLRRQRPTQQD